MRLLVANPNSTEAITEACAALARAAASPNTEIVPWTNRDGPPVIDSLYGDSMAGRPLAKGLVAHASRVDAVVLAGFGGYGTGAIKEALDIPVVGLPEAAMAFATPLCHRFVIITTSPRMIPYTQDLVQALGFAPRCAAVRAVDLPPLGKGEPPAEEVVAKLAAESAAATWGGTPSSDTQSRQKTFSTNVFCTLRASRCVVKPLFPSPSLQSACCGLSSAQLGQHGRVGRYTEYPLHCRGGRRQRTRYAPCGGTGPIRR